MEKIYKIERWIILLVLGILIAGLGSCKKYLSEKSDKSITTPSSLADLSGILDEYSIMNGQFPFAGEISADDYSVLSTSWSASSERQRNFYIWKKSDDISVDWNGPYRSIFNANLILETIPDLKIPNDAQTDAGVLKGQALFIRAWYHYALANLFAPVYQPDQAKGTLGIPLKLRTDINQKIIRSSLFDNYQQIITDAQMALRYLPLAAKGKYLASKPAAYAFLARVYLQMQDYQQSKLYADSCLSIHPNLIDYNNISATAAIPFSQFNEEVLYDCRTSAAAILGQNRVRVDELLYGSYQNNDLRKDIFFKTNTDKSIAFKGNYTGLNTASVFSGLAKDEVWLIRAECLFRMGEVSLALDDLNFLLSKRFKTGNFEPYRDTPDFTLAVILQERRKELLFRNLRWSDLKRLNLEPQTSVVLKRTINNVNYELLPNSPRYVLQIDKKAILYSDIEQNP